jgi:sugar lactone lactonase YvrE
MFLRERSREGDVVQTLQSTVLVDGLGYLEGPRWRNGKLWFSDCQAGVIYAAEETGKLEAAVRTGHPSGLGWTPDGTLVFATLLGAKINQVAPGGVELLHDLSGLGGSTNDMVVDRHGRIYVDLYEPMVDPVPPKGSIVFIPPGGAPRVAASDLMTPNGMAITPDGSTLILSETFGRGKIWAYPILADGSLGVRRVFADLGQERTPDGICLDAEGAIWVGSAYSREFLRVREGGEITHRVETPEGFMSVAAALGGADGKTLFLMVNETRTETLLSESKGRVETVRVEVPGIGSP